MISCKILLMFVSDSFQICLSFVVEFFLLKLLLLVYLHIEHLLILFLTFFYLLILICLPDKLLLLPPLLVKLFLHDLVIVIMGDVIFLDFGSVHDLNRHILINLPRFINLVFPPPHLLIISFAIDLHPNWYTLQCSCIFWSYRSLSSLSIFLLYALLACSICTMW